MKKVRNNYNNFITNIPSNTENNLSIKQRTSMKEISTNTNIAEKGADKEGAITINNTCDHITDCALLLNDTKIYQTASSDIIDTHVTKANSS